MVTLSPSDFLWLLFAVWGLGLATGFFLDEMQNYSGSPNSPKTFWSGNRFKDCRYEPRVSTLGGPEDGCD
jgi:hypothetical protein